MRSASFLALVLLASQVFAATPVLPYGFAIGAKRVNQRLYGVSAYPTAVLIDRRGMVRYISVGVAPGEMEELQAMIEKPLKEPAH